MMVLTLVIEHNSGECTTEAFLNSEDRAKALYKYVRDNWEEELDREIPEEYQEFSLDTYEDFATEYFNENHHVHFESYILDEVGLNQGSNHVYILGADEIREMAEEDHEDVTDEEVDKIISTLNSPKCSTLTEYVETVIDTTIAFARS